MPVNFAREIQARLRILGLLVGLVAIALAIGLMSQRHGTVEQRGADSDLLDSAPSQAPPPPAAQRNVAPQPGKPMASVAPLASKTPLDEASLMQQLRALKDSDAERAIALAREGNQRFPDSPAAPERASILIRALASLGRSSEARGEAEDMVNRYPDSNWVREVERFTGAHRHRNLRLDDAGNLESY